MLTSTRRTDAAEMLPARQDVWVVRRDRMRNEAAASKSARSVWARGICTGLQRDAPGRKTECGAKSSEAAIASPPEQHKPGNACPPNGSGVELRRPGTRFRNDITLQAGGREANPPARDDADPKHGKAYVCSNTLLGGADRAEVDTGHRAVGRNDRTDAAGSLER